MGAGALGREIHGSARGRRDISPALALRNAQQAASRGASSMLARAATTSAMERQAAENQLAQIRQARISSQVNAGLAGLSQAGAFLAAQGAAQRQDRQAAQRLQAQREANRALASAPSDGVGGRQGGSDTMDLLYRPRGRTESPEIQLLREPGRAPAIDSRTGGRSR